MLCCKTSDPKLGGVHPPYQATLMAFILRVRTLMSLVSFLTRVSRHTHDLMSSLPLFSHSLFWVSSRLYITPKKSEARCLVRNKLANSPNLE